MFHQFEELGITPCLVAGTELVYEENANLTYLRQAVQTGYKKVNSNDAGYLARSLPPVEFSYSQAQINSDVNTISNQSLENLPTGMSSQNQRYVDLNSEGLSGFLAETQGAWYYKPNLGNGEFGAATVVARTPATVNGRATGQIVDLGGDGSLDIVSWNLAIPSVIFNLINPLSLPMISKILSPLRKFPTLIGAIQIYGYWILVVMGMQIF